MVRRWLVTGCSSGLGQALAAAAARAGDQVVVTARRPDGLRELVEAWPGQIRPVTLDVRDEQQCRDAVDAAVEHFGGIDVLVNNAGGGLFGAVEEVCDEELRDQLETLVVAPWRLARLVLPVMRAQGAGHIVNISSVAGRVAFPGLSAYMTGKAALEAMSHALASEVAPLGIRVTVMEPGAYRTRYGSSLAEAGTKIAEYAPVYAMLGIFRDMDGAPDLGRPEDFAQTVLGIVAAGQPTPLRVPIGPDAHDMITGVEQAALAELAAANALTAQLAQAAPNADGESQPAETQAVGA